MSGIVRTLTLTPRDFDLSEIIRYMGGTDTSEVLELVGECVDEARGRFAYRVCYTELDVTIRDGVLDFGAFSVTSRDLCRCLSDCRRAVIFGATVGLEIDRLIAAYGRTFPAKALCMQAIGAERIEALCDAFCEYLEAQGMALRPRFSAGYGDLPLEFQRDMFRVLDCPKRIGLTLSDSLLMSPTKSVTAVVGVK